VSPVGKSISKLDREGTQGYNADMTARYTEAIPGRKDIQTVVDQIGSPFSSSKVILAGSYADGTLSENSDVDLMDRAATRPEILGIPL